MPQSRTSLSSRERQLRSQLRLLLNEAEGFLHGSLIEMARRCGNPRCACASDESKKHRSLYLGQTLKGKGRMKYIAKDQEGLVGRWAADFQQARELLEALSQEGWRRLEKSSAEAKAGKAAGKKARKSAAKKKAKKKNLE